MKQITAFLVSAALTWAIPISSYAQGKCETPKPSSSSGLTVAVTNILNQKDVTIQFLISNNTNGRVYLKSAQTSDSGKAFLGSGAHLDPPQTVNIENTHGFSGSDCLSSTRCTQNINEFSYIEPKESLPFSFKYRIATPAQGSDTISFSVVMVTRFSASVNTSEEPGQPKLVRFNFNAVPLGC